MSDSNFAGDEDSGTCRALYILTLGLLLMSVFSLVQSWTYGWTGAAFTLAGEILCLAAALWFTRRGNTVWATRIICGSELVCGLLLTSVFGPGFRDSAMLLFPLILVAAAVLLDWRSYAGFAGLVVVSVACSGLIQVATQAGTKYPRVFNTINMLLTTVVAVGLLARNLKRSVVQSRAAEADVKALSARLITTQEEERSRLARELHDDFGQQIAALSIGMSNLMRQFPSEESQGARAERTDPEKAGGSFRKHPAPFARTSSCGTRSFGPRRRHPRLLFGVRAVDEYPDLLPTLRRLRKRAGASGSYDLPDYPGSPTKRGQTCARVTGRSGTRPLGRDSGTEGFRPWRRRGTGPRGDSAGPRAGEHQGTYPPGERHRRNTEPAKYGTTVRVRIPV